MFKGFTIVAVTDSANDAYGIIMYHAGVSASKHQTQRYHRQQSYNTATHTYIENITDTLGYTSTAKYDVRFVMLLWTRDISCASMQYQYYECVRIYILSFVIDKQQKKIPKKSVLELVFFAIVIIYVKGLKNRVYQYFID